MKSLFHAFVGIAGAFLSLCAWQVAGQNYPNKVVRIVVPQPGGGGVDFVARVIAQKLSENLGQPFIVENRPGAGGMVGAGLVVKAPADGYTLLLDASTHVTSSLVYKGLSFDAIKDFTPITQITSTSYVVAVHPSVAAKNVRDLARVTTAKVNWATAGVGSIDHLALEALKSLLGISLAAVPYKGLSPGIADLVGGHVLGMVIPIQPALPHIKAGRIKALAVTGAARSPALPNTPTVAESGLAGFKFVSWHGLWGPGGLPKDVVTNIHAEISKAVRSATVREKLPAEIFDLVISTPGEFAKFIEAEIASIQKSSKKQKYLRTENLSVWDASSSTKSEDSMITPARLSNDCGTVGAFYE